jgi:lysophospholipase L1-like esterase
MTITSYKHRATTIMIVLVGDSDIARWPQDLWPSTSSTITTDDGNLIVSGHNGLTLPDLIPHMEQICLQRTLLLTDDKIITMIICCGENDIGNSIPLWQTRISCERMLDIVFPPHDDVELCQQRFVVFLGPKIEPWLQDDSETRKQHIQLSATLQQCCLNHKYTHQIYFVDCLLMFCYSETIHQPGALHHGGKPDPKFFDSDQLHLSIQGYRVWQDIVNRYISEIGV